MLRKAYAAGYYAMCAPGFEPQAMLALPDAAIAPMSPEASTNAIYAKKIEAIDDADERQRFVGSKIEEQAADADLVNVASRLVVDAIIEPTDLREALIKRFRAASGWTRARGRRHHVVSPV
ncbi:acetyl-CoA carboxylase carboxyltransferase component [Gordonia hydrophobica]|nr:acetyl-CoA carboxylase carboxyltransferase component [Gordonia hydrophobica]